MTGSSPERQRRILELLEGKHFIRTSELSEAFAVSTMTLWRDLREMEEKGLIRRARGRIMIGGGADLEPPFRAKLGRAAQAKEAIAAFTARHFFREGETIALDGGTTVAALAGQMLPPSLTILTNSLHTAERFSGHPARPSVYVCGGYLRRESGTFIGREALGFFNRRRAHRYFLTGTGVDAAAGITDLTLEDNEVKQAMAGRSPEVILLADQGKIGHVSLMQVLPWRRIHHFVTDADISQTAAIQKVNPALCIHHVKIR